MKNKKNVYTYFFVLSVLLIIYMGYTLFTTYQQLSAYCNNYNTTMAAQHKRITPKNTKVHLQDKEDNKASRMAKYGSAFVVDTLHGGVEVLSSLFDSLLN